MKQTQRVDAVRNIRKRIVSYLSICLIVMLGTGGFFTTRYMYRGLMKDTEDIYDDRSFENYSFVSTVGMSEDDMNYLKNIEGVADVEGMESVNVSLNSGKSQSNVDLFSLTQHIDVPEVVEGVLPQKNDECIVSTELADSAHLEVGDEVTMSVADAVFADKILKGDSYKVVGVMKHPKYINVGLKGCVAIPRDAFDLESLDGCDMQAVIRLDGEYDKDIFSDTYYENIKDVEDRIQAAREYIEKEATERLRRRLNKTIDKENEEAEAKLADAQKKIDDGKATLEKEVADAEKKLNDGEKELEEKLREAQAKINSGEAELKAARAKLDEAKRTLEESRKNLEYAESLLNRLTADKDDILSRLNSIESKLNSCSEDDPNYQEAVDEAVNEYVDLLNQQYMTDISEAAEFLGEEYYPTTIIGGPEDLRENISLIRTFFDNGGFSKISELMDQKKKEIADAEAEIAEGEAQYKAGLKKLEDAKRLMKEEEEKGRKKIEDGWAELEKTKAEKEKEISDAQAELDKKRQEAEDQLEDGRKAVSEMTATVVLIDRRSNGGYVDLDSTIASIDNAGTVFGILFLLVGALVCFSTLTMIIEEQIKQVGTTKAFGFRNNEVLKKYMLFGVSAAIVGSITGVLMGYILSKLVLSMILREGMYTFTYVEPQIPILSTILVAVGAVLVCAITTFFACTGLLKSPASILMKGVTVKKERNLEKKRGKKSHGIGTLYSRLIIRNIKDDKVRVILTIVIIMGSVIIIGIGITARYAFSGMMNAELEEVYAYDSKLTFSSAVTEDEKKKTKECLERNDVSWIEASEETNLYYVGDRTEAIVILTADPEEIDKAIILKDPETKESITLPQEGILLQNRTSENYGFDTGDEIKMYSSYMIKVPVTIEGIFQNYQGRLAVMSKDAYRKEFGDDPDYNTIFMIYNKDNKDAVCDEIKKISNNISVEDDVAFLQRFKTGEITYNSIAIFMLANAVIMSFLVLTNLNNIFVMHKKRELIVMRVNGFSLSQTVGYLVREIIFVTLVGILLAMIIGMSTNPLVMKILEPPDVQYIREPSLVIWTISALIEAVFMTIISTVSFWKIRKFSLKEIAEE